MVRLARSSVTVLAVVALGAATQFCLLHDDDLGNGELPALVSGSSTSPHSPGHSHSSGHQHGHGESHGSADSNPDQSDDDCCSSLLASTPRVANFFLASPEDLPVGISVSLMAPPPAMRPAAINSGIPKPAFEYLFANQSERAPPTC